MLSSGGGARYNGFLFPSSPLPLSGQPTTFPPEALWVTVGLSVCLIALLVALAFVCWRKIKQSCEEENAGEPGGACVYTHAGFGVCCCLDPFYTLITASGTR